ncbi:hypothetical protein ACIBG0_19710 [Nocardia sp. NPDC050630]|uniref:hypothetical protein n=1 Tax=Nocardia sp. NPDC050630 TaxID=3364321 RepID=UPI00378DBF2B
MNRSDVHPPSTAVRLKRTWSLGLLGHNDDHTTIAGSSAFKTIGFTSSGSRSSQGRALGCLGSVSDFQTVCGGAGKVRDLEPISFIRGAYAAAAAEPTIARR